MGWAWPGGPPNHRPPSAQSCHEAPTRWVPQGGFPGPNQGGRQPSACPKVPPSVCPLQLAAPTCQRPPHTAPQLPPFLPASESPLRARTALPTPGRGCTDSPRASSRALRECRWLCTPNLCWACPLELNAGLGLPGCQAGLGASPSIPSELGPCRAPLGQGPVRHVPARPQHQPAPQTPNEAADADAPHEDPTLGSAGAPGLKLPTPLTHADTHIRTLGAAEPTRAVPTGVLGGGIPRVRPPAAAASKPTRAPLPLCGAQEPGRGPSTQSWDHTMGAVSLTSGTETEVGGATRPPTHHRGLVLHVVGGGGGTQQRLAADSLPGQGWTILSGKARPLEGPADGDAARSRG